MLTDALGFDAAFISVTGTATIKGLLLKLRIKSFVKPLKHFESIELIALLFKRINSSCLLDKNKLLLMEIILLNEISSFVKAIVVENNDPSKV